MTQGQTAAEPDRAPFFQRVAVLGLGTMGHGIAQTMAAAGCEVRAYDLSPDTRSNLLARIHSNLNHMVAAAIIEESSIEQVLSRIVVCSSEKDCLSEVEFVTEAVSENLELKQELFSRLESIVAPTAILASNTSSYPITDIAVRMHRPQRAIVTHWFNPPHIVPVVEVVPGAKTSAETVKATCELMQAIGKHPVRVNQEIPGFLVNRVQMAMFREIWDLVDRGIASAEDIDRAIRGSMGLRLAALGPLAIIDFAGWDVTARVYQNLITHQRGDTNLPDWVQRLISEQRYGVKSGRGVFEYPPESIEQRIAQRDQRYLELVKLMGRPAQDSSQV